MEENKKVKALVHHHTPDIRPETLQKVKSTLLHLSVITTGQHTSHFTVPPGRIYGGQDYSKLVPFLSPGEQERLALSKTIAEQ